MSDTAALFIGAGLAICGSFIGSGLSAIAEALREKRK